MEETLRQAWSRGMRPMKTLPRKTIAQLLEKFSYELEIHIVKMGNFLKFKFLLSFYCVNFCIHTEIERKV